AEGRDVSDVLAVAAVVIACDIACGTVVDRARTAAELVPDRRLLAVGVVRTLDLVGTRGDPEHERAGKAMSHRREVARRLAGDRVAGHFSTPVMTMPRMKTRCAKK